MILQPILVPVKGAPDIVLSVNPQYPDAAILGDRSAARSHRFSGPEALRKISNIA
jgi:hypothetical protein